MKIILVEPDRLLAETYFQALVGQGHDVVPCASAQAAIAVADDIQPDLIILELQLIEHSGIEFLYEFRSYPDWQATPIIVHTMLPPAEFEDNYQMLRQELDVAVYLYKPQTTLKDLLGSVRLAEKNLSKAT
jgi:DNA-binding response OmpR family regulator